MDLARLHQQVEAVTRHPAAAAAALWKVLRRPSISMTALIRAAPCSDRAWAVLRLW